MIQERLLMTRQRESRGKQQAELQDALVWNAEQSEATAERVTKENQQLKRSLTIKTKQVCMSSNCVKRLCACCEMQPNHHD